MGDIAKAVRKIAGAETQSRELVPKAPQGAKPAVVGKGRTPASGSGGSAPLVETTYASRTYWPDESVTSTDGAFVWQVKPIKRVTLQGGGWIDFADPTP